MSWNETEGEGSLPGPGKAGRQAKRADNSPREGRFLESRMKRDPVIHRLSFLLNTG